MRKQISKGDTAMAVRWPGSGSAVSGSTPFGLYDDDATFQVDAPNMAIWGARRLGYPISDVELLDVHFYACFEESVSEYAAQVNQFNIRNNLYSLIGAQTGSSITGKPIVANSLPYVLRLSDAYGTEVGSGGNVNWKTGSIQINSGSQQYDLDVLYTAVSESGNNIEIRRIFFERDPAISRVYNPYAGSSSGTGTQNLLDQFGFGVGASATQFILMPIYEDLLRSQAIEFNDTVRKSAHGFELVNNTLRIFPRPTSVDTLHFHYTVREDRENIAITDANERTGSVSDYSNIPYQAMTYRLINEVGKQWIRKYTLALCKELLGAIRGRFSSIPHATGEIVMDGPELRAEAQVEKDALIEQLRETLEEVSSKNQMQLQADISDQHQQMLNKVPLPFYIL
jgi:hypothetical protein